MKKLIVALFAALLGMISMPASAQLSGQIGSIPGLPQAVSILATGAPQARADGQAGVQMADREGNAKASLAHGEYTESARRGRIFTTQTAAHTVVINETTGANIGSARPIVGFYNPTGSGVNAILLNEEEWHTSGTPAGPLMLNFFCGQNWTSVSSGTIFNNLLSNNNPNGSQMIPQNIQNLATTPAITTAMNVLQTAGGPPAVAIATAVGVSGHSKDFKGAIAVPPGCAIGLFATGIGTSDVVSASLSWEEVAQ